MGGALNKSRGPGYVKGTRFEDGVQPNVTVVIIRK